VASGFSFRRLRYTKDCQGYPCVEPINQNEIIVGDWSGTLFWITLAPLAIKNKAFVATRIMGEPACTTLASLVLAPANPMLCAVATRGGFAAIWDRENNKVTHIASDSGPVHSVAWLGDTGYLLLGTGKYPLSAEVWQARLEAWKVDEAEPSLLATIALPGVCVSAIAPCPDESGQIVAFSGMRSQHQGFITLLNANSFFPQSFFDLPGLVDRVESTEQLILASGRDNIRAISREEGKEKWVHKVAGELADFAFDPECQQLLLSNGELISAVDGEVVEKCPALAECSCVRTRPDGGFVAVSRKGLIGVWEERE